MRNVNGTAGWVVAGLVAAIVVGACPVRAQDDGPVAKIRELRLRGALTEARALAESELDRTAGDARREIALRLELARILDRVGLHQNTRPVTDALAHINAAASAAQRAGIAPLGEIELARATYYYRAEMAEREFPTADKHVRRAVELFRESEDEHGEADAIHQLGLVHLQRGELDRARALFDESWQLDRAGGERPEFRGDYERHVGFVHVLKKDTRSSIPYFTRSLHFRREAGAIDASLFAARILAWALLETGQTEQAKQHILYGLTIAEHIDSPVGRARCQLVLGRVLASEGETAGARRSLEAAVKAAESVAYTSVADQAWDELEKLPASSSPSADADSTTSVREAVSAFGLAYAAADIVTLRSLLTAGYVHVNGGSGSVLDRDRWLSWMVSRRADLENGKLVIESYRVSDIHIDIYGDVAIATGVVSSAGEESGRRFDSRIRFTNAWTKSADSWRRAVFVDSRLENR